MTELHNDKSTPKLTMSTLEIKGLPIKYTNAPKFVFLNDRNGGQADPNIQGFEESQDEFADLFKKMDIPDLTAAERSYINRFQQLGFWRKKFTETEETKS
jgi:hypothetical protein